MADPTTTPSSTLSFGDLIVEVARKIGVAYYGPNGDEEAQIPVNAHDLSECRRHVNNGIRMFINDAPSPNGWRWMRPLATVNLWGTVSVSTANTVTPTAYDPLNDKTTLTAVSASFYPSMELRSIALTGIGSYTISDYVSASVIKVRGRVAGATAVTWSLQSTGTFTLPSTFGGQHLGEITYVEQTNRGIHLTWVDEYMIRRWKENVTSSTGIPFWAAVRPMTEATPKRRWELLMWPYPNSDLTVLFPYIVHFDKLVGFDEVPPAPVGHDEAIRAACLAVTEKDVEGAPGSDWNYYHQSCLPNSYRIDAMAAPKNLGYFGNPSKIAGARNIQVYRDFIYQRPPVGMT